MEFLNNLWKKIKDFYFKARTYIAQAVVKSGVLQYTGKLIDTVKFKKAMGQTASFTDYLKVAAGWVLEISVFAVLGAIIGVASVFVILALSFVIGDLAAVVLITVLRTLFIFDLVKAIHNELFVSEAVNKFTVYLKSFFASHPAAAA